MSHQIMIQETHFMSVDILKVKEHLAGKKWQEILESHNPETATNKFRNTQQK